MLFSCTTAPARKFAPFIISVNPDFPAVIELGLSELVVGAGTIPNGTELEEMPFTSPMLIVA